MKIFVSVGTHEQAFQRLLDMAGQAARVGDHTVVAQYGIGHWSDDLPSPLPSVPYLSPSEMRERLDWCDVFVSQSSPGNLFGSLQAARWPLVLGRRKTLKEHVDDHQVEFAMHASRLGLCTNLDETGSIEGTLASLLSRYSIPELHDRALTAASDSNARAETFRTDFWAMLQTHFSAGRQLS